jgi:cytochrome c2
MRSDFGLWGTMKAVLSLLAAIALICSVAPFAAQNVKHEPVVATHDWKDSAHGRMLRRVLPPGPAPEELPEPGSDGAQLLDRYCTQCHYLPSPAMHTPGRWPGIVERMARRMRGEGNLGAEMKELMKGLKAPSQREVDALVVYLRKHSQEEIDPGLYAKLTSPEGKAFSDACSQCHALPDPRRHTAEEWPEVVERMQKHLAWAGTVKSNLRDLAPQLEVDTIVDFLRKNSRAP